MSLDSLNPIQREAATHVGSPLLILAGAGSGKTRVLTHKIVYLVEEKIFAPENILAVTFTNKASKEMKTRIGDLLPPHLAYPLWVSTFHSLGVQILRKYCEVLGYKRGFSIYDTSDQQSVLKKCIKKLELNDKIITPKFCQSRIDMVKSMALSTAQIHSQKQLFSKEFSLVFEEYEKELKQANAFDFGDLIYKTLLMIEKFPEVKEELQNTFKYILVDEYQDTNSSQYRLMKALCRDKNNICVVGDEDQSIYGWRGADITNILNFEKDFPNPKTIKLEQNYRSTQNIISAAYNVIKNNSQRHDKKLFTENPNGEKIKIVETENEYDEGKFVADKITSLVNQGHSLHDIAIFYRTNAQSRILEEQLRNNQISYKLYGGQRFYDRKEIKDVASYLNLLLNPTDDVCFKRVVNVPARGLGKTSIEAIERIGIENQISMVEASIRAVQARELTSRATNKLSDFLNILVELRKHSENMDLYALYNEVLTATGYLKELERDDTIESQSRIENLQEFGNAILRFTETHQEDGTLERFLSDMALLSDTDQDEPINQPHATMMTLHISKGLEFPFVFMVGMEDGLFPGAQSIGEAGDKLEEERRLCYVGMTRAEKELFMSHSRSRRHWGEQQFNPPSRFLSEIPDELFENISRTAKRPAFMSRGFNGNYKAGPSARNEDSFDSIPDYENFSDSTSENPFRTGMRVRHPVYGAGAISQVEGQGEATKISIQFQNNSVKKFIAKYANITII
jgi:DNA helicase II / ATP-dependent DNA helicase PcrA